MYAIVGRAGNNRSVGAARSTHRAQAAVGNIRWVGAEDTHSRAAGAAAETALLQTRSIQ